MMRRVALLVLLAGCSAKVEKGLTGVEITVARGELELDQLRFEGDVGDVEGFPPTLHPDAPGTIRDEESLVVLVADELAGSTFVARVYGLQGGTTVAAGIGSATLTEGEIMPISVVLGDAPTCGDGIVTDILEACDDGDGDEGDGCDSSCRVESGWSCMHTGVGPSQCESGCGGGPTCDAGQRCLGGECVCDNVSCEGCCRGTMCLPGDSSTACGTGGLTCNECGAGDTCDDGVCSGCTATTCPDGCCSGSTCNPMGIDSCGLGGVACTPCDMLRADRCVGGSCMCGDGDPCSSGQRCVAGLCICDQTSCPAGCCEGAECRVRTAETCGVAGSTCVACSPTIANGCSATGTCQCGSGSACGSGQRCLGGNCVCDSTSCPTGCCAGNVCRVRSLTACGPEGGMCTACDSLAADGCSAGGTCQCGGGPPCDAGQRCDGGVCVCDGISCDGCCNGDACETGDGATSCGAGGAACEDCGAATCAGGVCSSCNSSTCPDGCCSGATCRPAALGTCGTGGAACTSCNPTVADQCVDGSCACGPGGPCGPGQRCVSGTCRCDSTSCPDGCCAGNQCRARSASTCGVAGEACTTCSSTLADNCDEAGDCVCGSRPACSMGQRCVGGDCVCDGTSCAGGCCSGPVCTSPPTVANCGTGGFACTACDPAKADGCGATGCTCGGAASCGSGQACIGGTCACTSASCSGCCEGNICRPGTTPAACGVGGSACEACATGECVSGVCAAACSDSCGGCCAGSACVDPASLMQCGRNGTACVVCDPITADRCHRGECSCGGGPTAETCEQGQHCLTMGGGTCVCDAVSCPSGCCQGNACQPRSATTCGFAGSACVDCTTDGTGDGCSPTGGCTCGGGPVCTGGLACTGGACS